MRDHAPPRAVIFDLGGVIVELGPIADLLGDGGAADAAFWPRWLGSEAVRAFEAGFTSPEEFARAMVSEFQLDFGPGELIERFRDWPRGLFDGATELVEELRRSHPSLLVAALSNSNPIHWWEQTDGEKIRGLFDRPFLSYEMNLVKPDRAVFVHVTEELDVEPVEIVYLDDNELNIEAARAVGWQAHVACGPADCRAALSRTGLLASL